uniref:Integrase n=2 Tax=Meloidogyne incognita TaxID=6306 RepID=A0A914KSR6_MELIC
MASSGSIRRQLGLALKALRDQLIPAIQALTPAEGEIQNQDSLRAARFHLSRALVRVDDLHVRWTEFIDTLGGEALEHEERAYQEFSPRAAGDHDQEYNHFMDMAERARGVINEIDYLLEEASVPSGQGSQATLTEQSEHVYEQKDQNVKSEHNNNLHPIEVRLPELKMDPFYGDPKKWTTFWQLFSANIDSRPMDNIRKMSYLLAFLQGSAKELVAGFVLSNENYDRALDLLKSRYGNSRAITEALEAELMNLHPPNESSHSLRVFVDSVERICRQLEAYGTMDKSPFVSTVIKTKLPHSIISKLVENERKSLVRWDCSRLRQELCDLVEISEEVRRCIQVKGRPQGGPIVPPIHQRNDHRPSPRPNEQFRSFGAQSRPIQGKQLPPRGKRFCSLCNGGVHFPSECPRYATPQARFQRLKEQNRCVRCLGEGHYARECPSSKICAQCQGNHHLLVCTRNLSNNQKSRAPGKSNYPSRKQTTQMALANQSPATGSNSVKSALKQANRISESTPIQTNTMATVAFANLRKKPSAYLMTRKIAISNPRNPSRGILAYAFFDPGSQLSYITQDLVNQIRPPQISQDDVEIHGFGGTIRDPIRIRSPSYAVSVQREDGGWEEMELNWTKEISTPFEMAQWASEMPKGAIELREIQQAIKFSSEVPGIMLGTRHFWKYFQSKTEVAPGLFVIQTSFGPVVGGETDMSPQGGRPSYTMSVVSKTNEDQMPPANLVEEFWNLEGIGIKENPSADDDQIAMNQLNSSISQDKDNRYLVSWIWREPRQALPSNYRMVYSRLCSTYGSLNQSSDLLNKYHQIFQDYLDKGMIEPARRNPDGQEHYLAHHAVITHKVRPVFDASAHPKGQPSLNDCLLRGPVLLPELVGLLLRFRLPKFIATADLESAFLMVGLHQADREFAKFLWVKDPSNPPIMDNIQVYRFTRVAFGVTCSPFLLAGVIRHHLKKYSPGLGEEMVDSLYVDNLHLRAESWSELLNKCRNAKRIFLEAKMNLREFASNSLESMSALPAEDHLGKSEAKVLGMNWDTLKDDLGVQWPKESVQPRSTRRTVLSALAGIFDPLGLISPAILPAKIFFQQLWDEEHDWDTPLSEMEQKIWEEFIKGWQIPEIRLPRRVLSSPYKEIQLHTFVDASSSAYAAAVYLRSESEYRAQANIIFSKNRLKPKKGGKTLTIPRMELIAILIGIRASDYVQKELKLPVSQTHIWSDSQIALSWVRSSQSQPTFVQRRLVEIRSHEGNIFHYIRTDSNPADVATRGISPAELKLQKLWWFGPKWLTQPESEWPEEVTFRLEDSSPAEENPKSVCLVSQSNKLREIPPNPLLKRFSSWSKTLRTMAYVLRFIGRTTKKEGPSFTLISKTGHFKASDYNLAEIYLIRWEQAECAEELSKFRSSTDSQGVKRLQTRITNSQGPKGLVHPTLLPKHSEVGKLIINHIHHNLCHGGVSWTLTEYLNQYWQPGARMAVRKVVMNCPSCRKMNSYKYALPTMPPLPSDRVQQRRPFQSIGVDYAGPTLTKIQEVNVKCWLVLITCLTTGAVYLEPTLDLTAASFLNVFRRFVSRRGRPDRVLSDNGRNFVLAEKAIRFALASHSAESRIEWKFIPSLSPWAGGIYERMVGMAKNCFKRSLGKRILPYDQLATFTAEVEATLNTRPLTHTSDEEGEILPLRPIDFIQPGAVLHCDPLSPEQDKSRPLPHEQLIAWWKATLENLDNLWMRWRKEYLVTLRDRSKWDHVGPRLQIHSAPKLGEVVLVENLMQPRNEWTLAKIVELNGHPGPIRSVKLLMPNGRISTRPVNKIFPLEASPIDTETENEPPAIETENPQAKPVGGGETPTREEDSTVIPEQKESQPEPQALEYPQELVQKENKAIEKSVSKHAMITRRRAKLVQAQLTIGVIFLLSLLTAVGNLAAPICDGCPSCKGCLVHCSKAGVSIFAPDKISKIQICCPGSCSVLPGQKEITHYLPKDVLVNDYTCHANFWDTNHEEPFEVTAKCAAFNPCQLVNCYFCLDLLANPSCDFKMNSPVSQQMGDTKRRISCGQGEKCLN